MEEFDECVWIVPYEARTLRDLRLCGGGRQEVDKCALRADQGKFALNDAVYLWENCVLRARGVDAQL